MRDNASVRLHSDGKLDIARYRITHHTNNLEKQMRSKTIGAAIFFAMLPFAALAQSVPPSSAPQPEAGSTQRSEARAKMRAACGTDIQKFCANIERGKGAMRSCLESHQSDLSAMCKAARAERAAARAKDRS
jgi:Cysteine rich repeat